MAKNNVRVNNLCDWPLYFSRIDGVGSVMIPRKAKNFALLSFDEVQSQIQVDNKMFTGEDGLGNHARIQIVDERNVVSFLALTKVCRWIRFNWTPRRLRVCLLSIQRQNFGRGLTNL